MIQIVKAGGEGQPVHYKEFMISSASDVSDLPVWDTSDEKTAPGSIAYTHDLAHIYLLGNDNTWREV